MIFTGKSRFIEEVSISNGEINDNDIVNINNIRFVKIFTLAKFKNLMKPK